MSANAVPVENFHYLRYNSHITYHIMDKVDTYDVCKHTFCEACTEPKNCCCTVYTVAAKKCHLVKSKMLTWLKFLVFDKLPWNLMGKSLGFIWEKVAYLDYQFWSLNECGRKYGSAANSVIYRFVLNVYSINSGILTTGEFNGDAIHCKSQSLLEHLYSALRHSLGTTFNSLTLAS